MKKLFGFCGIITCLVLNACKDKVVPLGELTNAYLPLAVGNYWNLDTFGLREITETKVFDGKAYYAIMQSHDTSYVRNEGDKIIEYYQGKTSVIFDLNADVNDTWQYRDYTVKLTSKTETIKIGGQEIKNCYRFYFDIPPMADDEHAIWLASGIGFIQQECYGACIGGKNKLKEMKLDGKVYRL
ncbi:hypothetical protein [Emticicia sp. BO119]|uniref:hypothetical protein n=1 Tax=Emticicia sp. BO119 TaxID=2757768 RepID=UPI0015F0A7E4|nr:hypothetical protein [Emticicia sp. BO119]MBA4851939.1 hypothetical protein [Emticicia sp. BO119]